jgi:RimJ/RimL family protein N-acetyltransferase
VYHEEIFGRIRTPRLELLPISAAFSQALLDGDRPEAGMIISAAVSPWLAANSAHVLQLAIAQAAERGSPQGGGRVVVLVERTRRRRAIGSVGFHGPADEQGRLEVGCRIDPAFRGRGYAGEAMTAMFEWAAGNLGITRFLVSVSSPEPPGPRLVAELELTGRGSSGDRIADLEAVLDAAP